MRFETKENLETERKIMDRICKDAIKLGDYELDFLIKDKAYIEIKNYNYKHDALQFYFINLIKLVKMQECSKKLPTYLFIQWTDKLTYINFKDITGHIKTNGRTPREGSTNDQELIVHVDPKLFTIYNK
jgi:hypothetical protein